MQKHLIFLIAILFSSTSFALLIGKVNIQKVLITVKEGQVVRDKLKNSFDAKQKILKKEEGKIRKMQTDLQKQGSILNAAATSKRRLKIEEEIQKLQQKSMTYQKEIQEMEQKLKKPILENVKGIVEGVSKKSGVEMTFESSTTPILYAKAEKDLTDDVIKAYDKKYKLIKKGKKK